MPKGVKGKPQATCHPDRVHYGYGLCHPCYNKKYRPRTRQVGRSRATCHPERELHADGLCTECYLSRWEKERGQKRRELFSVDPIAHKEFVIAKTEIKNRERERLKFEVLSHYSPNGVLGCCWEGCIVTDIDMLSLDHINDDGNTHLDKYGKRMGGTFLYRWAKANGYPDFLQTLCMNHQQKKKVVKAKADRGLKSKYLNPERGAKSTGVNQ